ncbi:MAG: hypothetical protein RRA92_00785, partial [Gemmatimonadota bacterium]|nr:hypothetical protein [Gemmatimonadota bacterium]
MAKHNFEVKKYQITLGDHPSTWGGLSVRARGIVACFGDHLRLLFYFLPAGAEMPAPLWNEDARVAVTFLPYDALLPFVDMLRNEKPIYGNIDTENPGDSYVSTMHEPVGEEEKRGGL